MTTLELQLDDDLNAFVLRQSRERGFSCAADYVESLLAIERLKARPEWVAAKLQEALDDPSESQVVDDEYWKRLEVQVFGKELSDDEP